jgi:hypothetical protein
MFQNPFVLRAPPERVFFVTQLKPLNAKQMVKNGFGVTSVATFAPGYETDIIFIIVDAGGNSCGYRSGGPMLYLYAHCCATGRKTGPWY